MRRLCKILLLLVIVAALPLRGYSASVADFCAHHHEGASAGHASHDDHGPDHEHTTPANDPSSGSSVCSHCASCSVGASLAPQEAKSVTLPVGGAARIPFIDARKPGHVPEHLERPPLFS